MNNDSLIKVGDRWIGNGNPTYIIAEIGINHNGSLDMARQLIDGAAEAGCDAVKFQKRTPHLCVPRHQWDVTRETPWGVMSYIEYREKLEFDMEEYLEIDRCCRQKGIAWTASCWDEPSVDFIEQFDPPFYKASSSSLTDHNLLLRMKATGKPLMISTGMSTQEEIDEAVSILGEEDLLIAHSTSAYPCPVNELNLFMIRTLKERYPGAVIGYSGHETGLATTYAAVVLGAAFVERHITLDRALWGTDQAASVEIHGIARLVRHIQEVEQSLGDGIKKLYKSELAARRKLRRITRPQLSIASYYD
jgi:N-acetylneuraminate synthase